MSSQKTIYLPVLPPTTTAALLSPKDICFRPSEVQHVSSCHWRGGSSTQGHNRPITGTTLLPCLSHPSRCCSFTHQVQMKRGRGPVQIKHAGPGRVNLCSTLKLSCSYGNFTPLPEDWCLCGPRFLFQLCPCLLTPPELSCRNSELEMSRLEISAGRDRHLCFSVGCSGRPAESVSISQQAIFYSFTLCN